MLDMVPLNSIIYGNCSIWETDQVVNVELITYFFHSLKPIDVDLLDLYSGLFSLIIFVVGSTRKNFVNKVKL